MSKRAAKTWKRWTVNEEELVVRHASALSDAQIAKLLDRTAYSVRRKRALIGVLRIRSQRMIDESIVFEFVVGYKRANDGNSPTFREIRDGCDLSSTSVAASCLDRLVDQGKISLGDFGGYRSIRVTGGKWIMEGEEAA